MKVISLDFAAIELKARNVILFLSLISMLVVSQAVLCEEDELTIGVFPRRNLTTTIKAFSPIAEYLSKGLGRKVKVESTKNFNDFWMGVSKEKYDIVHYNQYHYIRSHNEKGYRVILKNEEGGKSTIAGSLIVRKDSNYLGLNDLKGKRIVFGGGKRAMQSYIVATYLLRQGGLKQGDYVEEFSINPVNAIMAAYFGKAAAGGSADKNLHLSAVTSKINIDEMRYLAVGKQLAHLPWAVSKNVDSDLTEKIRKLLIDLKYVDSGRKLLRKAGLTGLVRAEDREYDPHRKIVYEVLGESY